MLGEYAIFFLPFILSSAKKNVFSSLPLKKLTTKSITHVMDPVFLLTAEDYKSIIANRIMKEKYLLLYLPVNDNKKLRKQAKEYAKQNNLKILEITTKLIPRFGHKTLTSAGIEEFLSSIKYAEMIFTNSFHAICFSIIFEREFYAFTRKHNGKVEDICKTFGLEERFLSDNEINNIKKIDYSTVQKKVSYWRKKSQDWLIKSIEE